MKKTNNKTNPIIALEIKIEVCRKNKQLLQNKIDAVLEIPQKIKATFHSCHLSTTLVYSFARGKIQTMIRTEIPIVRLGLGKRKFAESHYDQVGYNIFWICEGHSIRSVDLQRKVQNNLITYIWLHIHSNVSHHTKAQTKIYSRSS